MRETADNWNAAQVLAALESARRPGPELDRILHELIFPTDDRHIITNHVGVAGERNAYSKSIDAALMLVETWLLGREEELGEEWEWRVHRTCAGSFCGVVWRPDDINHEYIGAHPFPSLALLIALTKAAASVSNVPAQPDGDQRK